MAGACADNWIGAEGAKALAEALETNTALRHLDLAKNLLGVEAGVRLLRACDHERADEEDDEHGGVDEGAREVGEEAEGDDVGRVDQQACARFGCWFYAPLCVVWY